MSRVTAAFSVAGLILLGAHAPSQARARLHKTAFEESVTRYPAPLAVIELIKSVTPFQSEAALRDSCLQIGQASSAVLGAIDPGQLQPLEQTPGALFFNYFEKCVKKIAKLGFETEELAKQNSPAILDVGLSRELLTATGQIESSKAWASAFNRLPKALQEQIVDQFIYFLLGNDEILRHYGYIGEKTVFGRPFAATADLRRYLLEQMTKSPTVQNESVLSFYSRLAVLLRLGPALKN